MTRCEAPFCRRLDFELRPSTYTAVAIRQTTRRNRILIDYTDFSSELGSISVVGTQV